MKNFVNKENKYYFVLVTKMSDCVRVEATKVNKVGWGSYVGGDNFYFKPKFQQNLYEIKLPTFIEKFFNITYEDKIKYAKKKVQKWCDRENNRISVMEKLDIDKLK